MTRYTVKLIGVNEYANETPLLSTLTAMSSALVVELEVSAVGIVGETVGETVQYLNKKEVTINQHFLTGSLVVDYKFLPTTSTSFASYYPISPLFAKKYIYIYSSEYMIELKGLATAGKALRINITGTNVETEANGNIKFQVVNFKSGAAYYGI